MKGYYEGNWKERNDLRRYWSRSITIGTYIPNLICVLDARIIWIGYDSHLVEFRISKHEGRRHRSYLLMIPAILLCTKILLQMSLNANSNFTITPGTWTLELFQTSVYSGGYQFSLVARRRALNASVTRFEFQWALGCSSSKWDAQWFILFQCMA